MVPAVTLFLPSSLHIITFPWSGANGASLTCRWYFEQSKKGLEFLSFLYTRALCAAELGKGGEAAPCMRFSSCQLSQIQCKAASWSEVLRKPSADLENAPSLQ